MYFLAAFALLKPSLSNPKGGLSRRYSSQIPPSVAAVSASQSFHPRNLLNYRYR